MKIVKNGGIDAPAGFSAFGTHCGIKKKKLDLGVITSDVPAAVAAVYTKNKSIAAPLIVTKKVIDTSHQLQAIIVNSGIANACTGAQGISDSEEIQTLLSNQLGISHELIGVASTGVIGPRLPIDKIKNGINQINWADSCSEDFHKSILTTDTKTKDICIETMINHKKVTISGVAKGSGMIAPNMATMLAFITTDAVISSDLLEEVLKETTNQTFNQITVDGDTSTNDMVIVMANGQSKTPEIKKETKEYSEFKKMFAQVCETLAKKIAEDGEGATKLVEVIVDGAESQKSANWVAKKIVGSNLVKAAMFGEDPNWGRIICAIGNTGEVIEMSNISLYIEGVLVFEKGCPTVFDNEYLRNKLKNKTIHILIELNEGDCSGRAWGCDLTYDYVRINSVYHT